MKKISIMLLAGMLFLCACSTQNTTSQGIISTQNESSEIQNSSISSESSAVSQQLENDKKMSDEQVFSTFKELAEQGKNVIYWYYGDANDADEKGLEIELDVANSDTPYRKVGIFGTIAEMRDATEKVFTKKFSDSLLYNHAFTDLYGNDKPIYKEIDGALYRNIQEGGFGWPYQLTDEYDLSLQTDDLIVLGVKCNVADGERWYNCMMKKENGNWKLEKLYSYSPYSEYEELAAPALSSPIGAYDWKKITDIDSTFLVSYYIYQFCTGLGNRYNDANPYTVPASEVVENLSHHFDGINKEIMIAAAQKKYSSMEYDEATDAFNFYITFDRGDFIVCGIAEKGSKATLQTLSINKSGIASRWGYLTVQKTDDGLRYLSNHVDEIPEA